MEVKDFKNIIFDLGGVIINLDEQRTIRMLAQLSPLSEAVIKERALQFEAYFQFEKGLITENQFRDALRRELKISSSDQEIDSCMNAMLLDIPMDRINLLASLRGISIYLLSNTNSIHLSRFNEIVKETLGEGSIDGYFKKVYYSHLVNMRKPDRDIFELIINENLIDPRETLFLDDNALNLEGAEVVGISTYHVKHPSQLFKLFQ